MTVQITCTIIDLRGIPVLKVSLALCDLYVLWIGYAHKEFAYKKTTTSKVKVHKKAKSQSHLRKIAYKKIVYNEVFLYLKMRNSYRSDV